MYKYKIIFNPAAKNGKARQQIPYILDLLKNSNIDFSFSETQYPLHAIKLAESAIKDHDVILAAGGDGTINEIINGMSGSGRFLGIIPLGSGNDFIKTLGIPDNVNEAIKIICGKKHQKIDLGKANDRIFSNGVGIGFDAVVVDEKNKMKKYHEKYVYYNAIIKSLFKYKPAEIIVSMNNKIITQPFFMVSVGNGKYMGGGFMLNPDASFSDGKLDVCMIDNISKFTVMKHISKVIKGTHSVLEEVTLGRGNSVLLKSEQGFPVQIDGELYSYNLKRLEITVIPQSLNIFTM